MSMENFFNYLSKPVPQDEVDIWFKRNNILYEKMELYYDFIISLFDLIIETYLGENEDPNTNVELTSEDNLKHFEWCWKKTIKNFEKESLSFNVEGEHEEYLKTLFSEIFYNQKDKVIRSAIKVFFKDLFDYDKEYTMSDLDMISTLYKSLDKNLTYNLY